MTDRSEVDRLYLGSAPEAGDFVFDAAVARVFPDMIRRSVPGYAAILNMVELLTRMHALPDSRLYDLGCSLGASSLAMARGLQHDSARILAYDNARAMLDRAARHITGSPHSIDLQLADIREVEVERASVVVLNFTLQFLPPDQRLDLLTRIRDGLLPGGILILSEKVRGATEQEDAVLVEMHHAFKRAQGYSDMEISRKRSALEKVLLPETLDTHRRRLQAAGFARSDVWFQCFNFVSLVARP